jgi:hypothetical protein
MTEASQLLTSWNSVKRSLRKLAKRSSRSRGISFGNDIGNDIPRDMNLPYCITSNANNENIMAGEVDTRRMIGNTEHDMMIGNLIERTDQMRRQAEKLEATQETFNRLMGHLNITLTKMQGVLDGVIKERRDEKIAHKERSDGFDARLKSLEAHNDDLKFVADLRSSWSKVLIYGIIGAAIVIIAAAKLGAVVKFGE